VNPRLQSLQPYPFENCTVCSRAWSRTGGLHTSVWASASRDTDAGADQARIVGEPREARRLPSTAGGDALRQAIADWLVLRYGCVRSTGRPRCCRSTARARRCLPLRQTVVDPDATMPWWSAPPLLSDLRGRGTARRRASALREHPRRTWICGRLCFDSEDVGAGRSCSTSARRATRPERCSALRVEGNFRAC